MHWFFLAALASLLWATVNHIDKYLLSKYLLGQGIGVLMIFSSLFSFCVLPFVLFLKPEVLSVHLSQALVLLLSGVVGGIAVFFYLQALNHTEASVVIPFFQLQPLMAIILGLLFFNEMLTQRQFFGGLITIIGATILSFNFNNRVEFRKKVVIAVLLSSFFFTIYRILFKFAATTESFWVSTFWEYVGLFIFGLTLVAFIPAYRKQFIFFLKNNGLTILSLNFISEFLTTIGNMLTMFAVLLAPVALVFFVGAFQPLFVFTLGIFLTLLLPKFIHEDLSKIALVQKGSAVLLIISGAFLLN